MRGEKLVDRVYLPGQKNPIPLSIAPALQLLALARDEAHRASNALRTKVGSKRRLTSELDSVPGIGPRTRSLLLSHFGSTQAVASASEAQIVAAGTTAKQAKAIKKALRAGDTASEDAERQAIDSAFDQALAGGGVLDDGDAGALTVIEDE